MNAIFQNKMGVCRRLKALVLAGVLGVLAFGSSNSFADSVNCYGVNFAGLPGLTAPSLPAFGTYINANFTKGKTSSVLKVTQASTSSIFLTPWSPYITGISSTSYTLTANFNSSGSFTSGNVVIKGKFGTSTTSTTLMTANLTAFAKSSNGYIWGFNTNNIVCSSAVNTAAHGCTTAEVVYLGLASAQKSLTKSWKTKGVALTSVPVPAAVWLFGSGLLGFVSIARRKSSQYS
jgi:hypothetical protein